MTTDTCNSIREWYNMFVHREPYAITLLAFSPITILLNLSLIISFIATKQVTQNTSNILIVVISLYDLAAGSLTMPLTANVLLDKGASNACIKSKLLIILSCNGQSSIFLMVLLALDRYLHMNPDIHRVPSKLKTILKTPNIYVVVAATFIIINSLLATFAFELHQKLTVSIATSFAGISSVLLIILICLYIRGYLRIRKFADNNPVYNESIGPGRATPEYVRKLYKTVLAIVLLASIQHFPYCIAGLTLAFSHERAVLSSDSVFAYFFEFATLSTHAGCFTNCLAILHFNTPARNWIFRKNGIQKIVELCKRS